jgi:hypothetical protein
MRDLVEFELSDELAPAKAPDELWDRVMYGGSGGHVAARPVRRPWMMSAALTVVTVMGFWFTLKHAQAAAFTCEPSPAVALTSAKVVRGHELRMASMASVGVELPHRGGNAMIDGCGHCHAAAL